MTKLFSLLFLLSILATGCTVENKTESCTMNGRAVDCREMEQRPSKPQDPVRLPTPEPRFVCGRTTCDSVTEFCFRFEDSNGRALSATCQPQAPDCRTCECIERRVLAVYPNECANAKICLSTGDRQYTYSCRAQLQ